MTEREKALAYEKALALDVASRRGAKQLAREVMEALELIVKQSEELAELRSLLRAVLDYDGDVHTDRTWMRRARKAVRP